MKNNNWDRMSMGLIDENGNNVEKTPSTHPYSYDRHIVFRNGENEEVEKGADSDRMIMWDRPKHESSLGRAKNACGTVNFDEGFFVEKYLQAYYENLNIKLIYITKEANRLSGYPVWHFAWKTTR